MFKVLLYSFALSSMFCTGRIKNLLHDRAKQGLVERPGLAQNDPVQKQFGDGF